MDKDDSSAQTPDQQGSPAPAPEGEESTAQVPVIYLPDETATAIAPDGRRSVIFRVPEAGVMIKRVLAYRPKEYSYRWAYHPGEKVHILLFGWPNGEGAALAISEGIGDPVLNFLQGTTDIYITTEPVQDQLNGQVPMEVVQKVMVGNTVGLPDVKFTPAD